MEKLEQLNSRINMYKEILDTMPKNNPKNIKEYGKSIENIKMEFNEYQNEILKEIEKRLKKFKNISKNPEINELKKKIDSNEGVLYLVNTFDTAYQKMDLDKAMFNLNHYYKKNLEVVNEIISYCIKKFEEVGIELELTDFDYSEYVKEYFTIFYREMERENINSEKIKNKFEEIYWKCPEIIIHIELNLRHLYLKNEKKIDKYYENQKQNLLRNFTAKDIIERFEQLEKKFDRIVKEDKAILINRFLAGEISTKDYMGSSIMDCYERLVPKEEIENADSSRMNEIEINIGKFSNSIYEYKKYLKFKFIIDDIKRIYNEKTTHRNVYMQTKKEILKKENKRIALNKKINKNLGKRGNEKSIEQRNNIVLELKQLYKDLDINEIYDKVATYFNDESTINDVIYFASSFYSYIYTYVYKNNKEITEEEINELVEELKEFVKYPYKTIVNNVKITDERDILLMIKDRYKLLNMNIEREDLEQENLENLIDNTKKVEIMHNIKKNKINLEDVECACEFKKILDK